MCANKLFGTEIRVRPQYYDVLLQAWAIGNLAGDCTQSRDVVLRADALPRILELIQRLKIEKLLCLH